jgi:hypothetical protein
MELCDDGITVANLFDMATQEFLGGHEPSLDQDRILATQEVLGWKLKDGKKSHELQQLSNDECELVM